ncbi:hypothetical protein IE077_003395 [Cardiosporidium cionae]|uniref:Uncharacterized protein n=1 Tax=Cardiosporidium cionae TaxID=476202 RepID=A0ABQ7JF27_9APIC|nr:hypothetical protein IE077_003395 [Cardiosporidium cionae]|eukprot:KAF8822598.1 hypothetical protein IE077_003395 [Cardiosporidium cionae]
MANTCLCCCCTTFNYLNNCNKMQRSRSIWQTLPLQRSSFVYQRMPCIDNFCPASYLREFRGNQAGLSTHLSLANREYIKLVYSQKPCFHERATDSSLSTTNDCKSFSLTIFPSISSHPPFTLSKTLQGKANALHVPVSARALHTPSSSPSNNEANEASSESTSESNSCFSTETDINAYSSSSLPSENSYVSRLIERCEQALPSSTTDEPANAMSLLVELTIFLMQNVKESFFCSWATAIAVATILFRLLLLPVSVASERFKRSLQLHSPKLREMDDRMRAAQKQGNTALATKLFKDQRQFRKRHNISYIPWHTLLFIAVQLPLVSLGLL